MYTTRLSTTGKGHSKATPNEALNYAHQRGAQRWNDVVRFVNTVWDYAERMNIRPEVVFGQWCDETDVGKSFYWNTHLNPGGLRITYSGEASRTWVNGTDAALGMLHRLSLYIYGYEHEAISTFSEFDPLPNEVGKAGYLGIAKTVQDLSGRWAANPNYARQIVAHLNNAFPLGDDQSDRSNDSMDDGPIFGNVVHPPFVDKYIPNSQTSAWDDLGQRTPLGVCQHSMIGSLTGTDGWFRRGTASNGLTDYGIGGSTDGNLDGVIYRWNDPKGRRSGWANGSSDGLEGDGVAFVRKMGINAINRDLVSIERSDGGNINTPMSDRQFAAICGLTAYWFDQAEVPWDQFPLNPHVNLVTHLLHKEIATKDCPFPPVYNRIQEIQNRVRSIMKAAQVPSVVPPKELPPESIPVPDTGWPKGWTTPQLADRWGTIPRFEPNGGIGAFSFNENHAVINAWVARAAGDANRTHHTDLPRPIAWHRLNADDGRVSDVILFHGSAARAWALYRPDVNVRWVWAN
jgi:hypothetical protein